MHYSWFLSQNFFFDFLSKITSCRSSDHFIPPPYQTAPNLIPTKLGLTFNETCLWWISFVWHMLIFAFQTVINTFRRIVIKIRIFYSHKTYLSWNIVSALKKVCLICHMLHTKPYSLWFLTKYYYSMYLLSKIM